MQSLSNSDGEALAIAEWVSDLDDLGERELRAQADEHDRTWIEMGGHQPWLVIQGSHDGMRSADELAGAKQDRRGMLA